MYIRAYIQKTEREMELGAETTVFFFSQLIFYEQHYIIHIYFSAAVRLFAVNEQSSKPCFSSVQSYIITRTHIYIYIIYGGNVQVARP